MSVVDCTEEGVRYGSGPGITGNPSEEAQKWSIHAGRPHPAPAARLRKCHHIDAQYCTRNDRQKDNIQLNRGPVGLWRSSRSSIVAVERYRKYIHSLTSAVESIFCSVSPDAWRKYSVGKKIIGDVDYGKLDPAWGIWRSEAIVIDTLTDVLRGIKVVDNGLCNLVPLGNFTAGDVCLPGLGY